MAFLNQDSSFLLKPRQRSIRIDLPPTDRISLRWGENTDRFEKHINDINFLSEFFKFMPKVEAGAYGDVSVEEFEGYRTQYGQAFGSDLGMGDFTQWYDVDWVNNDTGKTTTVKKGTYNNPLEWPIGGGQHPMSFAGHHNVVEKINNNFAVYWGWHDGRNMKKSKSSKSKAQSYREIGEFWDTHDLAEYWDQTESVEFDVDIQSEVTYYALDSQLSELIQAIT